MARGRKTALHIRLTPADRQTLRAWQRSTTLPLGVPDGGASFCNWPMACRSPTLRPRWGSADALSTSGCSVSCRMASTGWRTKRDAGTGDSPAPMMGGLSRGSSWAEGGMGSASGVPAKRHALPIAFPGSLGLGAWRLVARLGSLHVMHPFQLLVTLHRSGRRPPQ